MLRELPSGELLYRSYRYQLVRSKQSKKQTSKRVRRRKSYHIQWQISLHNLVLINHSLKLFNLHMTFKLVRVLTQKLFHQKLWLSRKEAKIDVLLVHSNRGIICNSPAVVASQVVTPEGAQQSKMWTNPNGHVAIVVKKDY
jgi:hypothetical protein